MGGNQFPPRGGFDDVPEAGRGVAESWRAWTDREIARTERVMRQSGVLMLGLGLGGGAAAALVIGAAGHLPHGVQAVLVCVLATGGGLVALRRLAREQAYAVRIRSLSVLDQMTGGEMREQVAAEAVRHRPPGRAARREWESLWRCR